MGLTRRQSLWRVELPLAVPAIIAGVRVATVTTISLATIAAFITPLGLGAPIFSAIQTGANTEFIAAGAAGDRAGADRRRADRDRAAVPHAVGAGREHRPMSDLIKLLLADNTGPAARPDVGAHHHRGDRRRDRAGDRAADRDLAGPPAQGVAARDQRLQRRSRAAEPGADRDQPRVHRAGAAQHHDRARGARGPADPDQRLHGGRQRRPRRGRGRPRHGHERAPGAAAGRAAAVVAADLRRHPDGFGLRDRHRPARRARRRRRPRRHHHQPGHLRPGRA